MPARPDSADEPELVALLKADALGRIELLRCGAQQSVRRVACGRWGIGLVARLLLRREVRALRACGAMADVPHLVDDEAWARVPSAGGTVPSSRSVVVRSFLDGVPLSRASRLPADFFELLEGLVRALHARRVCHNDLHKEQNILVGPDGRPAVVDFQLASVHARASALFRSRVQDDLRHVHKHRDRYTRAMREPSGLAGSVGGGPAVVRRRSVFAAFWRVFAKPVYNAITRRVLRTRDGEERRPSAGPWPEWTARVGPRRDHPSL